MILYILSDITDAKQFEWIVSSNLNKKKFNIKFILINKYLKNYKLKNFLYKNNSILAELNYKNFFSYFYISIILFYIFFKHKPKIIHCHLRKASILGIIIGFFLGLEKRIITRHHGNENYKNYFKGYYLDKLISRLSTHIVSISKNTNKLLLQENSNIISKIHLIHHGFDFSYFNKKNTNDILNLKKKYKIKSNTTVIGSISRFVDWKGVDYTVKAFIEYNKIYPDSILILANARGPYKNQINKYLKLLPENSYRLVDFETNINSFYQLFNIFIHVPIDADCEAFGQVYIESLALKIPSIFTKSGVGSEFLEHKKNCYIANFKDSISILDGLIYFTTVNQEIKNKILNTGYNSVCEKFSINRMLNNLNILYFSD